MTLDEEYTSALRALADKHEELIRLRRICKEARRRVIAGDYDLRKMINLLDASDSEQLSSLINDD